MAGPPGKPRRPILDRVLGEQPADGDGSWLQNQLDTAVDRALAKVMTQFNEERKQAQEKIEAATVLLTTYMDLRGEADASRATQLEEVNKNLKAILKELRKMNKKDEPNKSR